MAGNQFKTDELGGLTFSATYTTEQYPIGTTALQHPDDLPAATINGTVVGNSGVSATTNFALLSGSREWVFVKAIEVVAAGQLCEKVALPALLLVSPLRQTVLPWQVIPKRTSTSRSI